MPQAPIFTDTRMLGIPGQSDPPESFNTAMQQIAMAAAQGVNIHKVGNLIGGVTWDRGGTIYGKDTNDLLNMKVLEADPGGYIIPRFWVPLASEGPGVYSREIGNEEGRAAGRAALEEYVGSIMASPYACRVIGFHIVQGENGEWRRFFPDPEGFPRWYAATYGDQTELPQGWEEALRRIIAAPESGTTFYHPIDEAVDIIAKTYRSEKVVDAIDDFAGVIKEKTGGKSLVITFYGYNKYVGHQEEHFALSKLLDSPNVDIISAPLGYSNRKIGQSAPFMSFQDSLALRGKLWVTEDDTRTYLAAGTDLDRRFGYVDTQQGSIEVVSRNLGRALIRGLGSWQFDLIGAGWWNDAALWEPIGEISSLYETKLNSPANQQFRPEVAVIFDEFSSRFIYPPLQTSHSSSMAEHFNRTGASVGYYLLDDLARIPDSVKVYYFLNAFYLDPEQRASIEAIKRDGNTLVWHYAPGYVTDAGLDIAGVEQLTGFKLKESPQRGVNFFLSDIAHPMTEGLRSVSSDDGGDEPMPTAVAGDTSRPAPTPPLTQAPLPAATAVGQEQRPTPVPTIRTYLFGGLRFVDPVISIDPADGEAKIIASEPYHTALFGVKRLNGWISIYIGTPMLRSYDSDAVDEPVVVLLRNIARFGGAHIYDDGNDPLDAGRGYVLLHAASSGVKTIRLPQTSDIYEALTEELLFRGVEEFSESVDFGETRLYRIEPSGE